MNDSRKVAKAFKKQHRNVLRSIRDLLAKTGKWGLLNFEHTPSLDAQNGQPYDCYRMTKDGFMLLVMGFSGETALRVKVAFIEAFNAMSEIVGRSLYRQRLALEARDGGSILSRQTTSPQFWGVCPDLDRPLSAYCALPQVVIF